MTYPLFSTHVSCFLTINYLIKVKMKNKSNLFFIGMHPSILAIWKLPEDLQWYDSFRNCQYYFCILRFSHIPIFRTVVLVAKHISQLLWFQNNLILTGLMKFVSVQMLCVAFWKLRKKYITVKPNSDSKHNHLTKRLFSVWTPTLASHTHENRRVL